MTSLLLLPLVALMASGSESAHPTAVPQTRPAEDRYARNACVQCHRKLAGRSAEIVDLEWAASVHFENNVACEGCHGGDASLTRDQFASEEAFKQAAHLDRNPEFLHLQGGETGFVSRARGRSISYFCGRCHTEIMEKHLGSPHGNFGEPSCLYCHGQGSHAIRKSSLALVDTRSRGEGGRCAICHQASTMQTVAEVKKTLAKASDLIDSSAAKFARLEEMGYRNLSLGEMHRHSNETHSRLRRSFHSFNMRDINEMVRSIESVAKGTDSAYEVVQSLQQARKRQTIVAVASVVFLLAFATLLLIYKKAFCVHSGGQGAVGSARGTSGG